MEEEKKMAATGETVEENSLVENVNSAKEEAEMSSAKNTGGWNKNWTVAGVVALLLVAGVAGVVINKIASEKAQVATSAETIAVDNGDLNTNWEKLNEYTAELTESYTIKRGGVYYLSGEISDGMLTVEAGDDDVKLVLNNVSIKNSSGPAIYVKSAGEVVVETAEGSENYLEDGKSYATEYSAAEVEGAIFSKSDISFTGSGKLEVVANYQDAIVGKDDLTIRSGEIVISAAVDGIRGKDSVHIVGGTIEISAKMDGIKSTNDTDTTKGFVLIEGGEIAISAGDDGIHATTLLQINDGKIDIAKSYEGIEGGIVTINGGEIAIVASDDGINVAGGNDSSAMNRPGAQGFSVVDESMVLTINGGNIYINAGGDGLDSNYLAYMNGGTVVVDGPTNAGNGALDAERGFYYSGGTLVAAGASGMATAFSNDSAGYSASIFFSTTQVAGTKVEIKNSAGETIVSYTSAKTFQHIAVGSEKFSANETYIIYVNGVEYESFTTSQKTTTVGSGGQGMMPGMGGQGQPRGRM